MLTRWQRLDKLNRALWIALLLALPVSSFPYFPFPGMQNAIVRPLALYPLIILAFTLVLPYLLKDGRLPSIIGLLLMFFFAAAAITGIALLSPSYPLRGQTTISRAIRAFATLMIGMGFLIVTILMTRNERQLISAIRCIYFTYSVSALWSLIQASMIALKWPSYAYMDRLQHLISVRHIHASRVTGFAYEPSWLAAQLCILVLPLLWVGRLTRFPILGKGRLAEIAEWLLLIVTIFVLALTYSRSGVLAFAVAGTVGAFLWFVQWARDYFTKVKEHSATRITRRAFARRFLGGAILFAGVLYGLVWVLEQHSYFGLLWSRFNIGGGLSSYLKQIGGGSRLAFASAGWAIFLEYPFLGVGLGQAGFYMLDRLPNWSLISIDEITKLMLPASGLYPNPKNLWVRLLAETGLVGATLFILFLIGVLLIGLRFFRWKDRNGRFMGLFCIMSLLAILIEGYTLDSFAMPAMWIALGIVIGVGWGKGRIDDRESCS